MAIDREIGLKAIKESINRITNLRKEHTEKALVETIEKYDFFVGSKDAMYKLKEVLPDVANIVYSPYIEDSKVVLAIKKFDIMDYIGKNKMEVEDTK